MEQALSEQALQDNARKHDENRQDTLDSIPEVEALGTELQWYFNIAVGLVLLPNSNSVTVTRVKMCVTEVLYSHWVYIVE